MFKLHAAIPLSELAHLVQETFDSFQFVRPTCRFRRGLRGPIPPLSPRHILKAEGERPSTRFTMEEQTVP